MKYETFIKFKPENVYKKTKNWIKNNYKKNIVDNFAMATATLPQLVAIETFFAGMNDDVSQISRIGTFLFSLLGFGSILSRGRDNLTERKIYERFIKQIKENETYGKIKAKLRINDFKQKIRENETYGKITEKLRINDFKKWLEKNKGIRKSDRAYETTYQFITTPFVYTISNIIKGAVFNTKILIEIGLATGIQTIAGHKVLGVPRGYFIDLFRDLSGIQESARIPEKIKNLKPRYKKGLIALLTASSLAITCGIYSLTPDKSMFYDRFISNKKIEVVEDSKIKNMKTKNNYKKLENIVLENSNEKP